MTTDPIGEGFAFFRWHLLAYPEHGHGCQYKRGGICFYRWTEGTR